jgi:hypothetical protein
MSGGGPHLTCTPPVMGHPTLVGLNGSVAFVPGLIRISPFGAPVASIDSYHVFLSPDSFVLARFVTDANGDAALNRRIPTDPLFCGSRWVVQAVILAPSGTRAFTASNALLVTLGS